MSQPRHTPGPWEWEASLFTGKPYNLQAPNIQDGRVFHPHVILKTDSHWLTDGPDANLIAAAPDMYEVNARYEAWEAKLVLCNEAWGDSLPRFTQELYDEWMEIQTLRNKAMAKARGEA